MYPGGNQKKKRRDKKKWIELINVYYVVRQFFFSHHGHDVHFVYSKIAFDFLFSPFVVGLFFSVGGRSGISCSIKISIASCVNDSSLMH